MNEERYLLADVESMLRAGYSHKEIERALRRMSPEARRDSRLRAALRALPRLLTIRGRTSRSTIDTAGVRQLEMKRPGHSRP